MPENNNKPTLSTVFLSEQTETQVSQLGALKISIEIPVT